MPSVLLLFCTFIAARHDLHPKKGIHSIHSLFIIFKKHSFSGLHTCEKKIPSQSLEKLTLLFPVPSEYCSLKNNFSFCVVITSVTRFPSFNASLPIPFLILLYLSSSRFLVCWLWQEKLLFGKEIIRQRERLYIRSRKLRWIGDCDSQEGKGFQISFQEDFFEHLWETTSRKTGQDCSWRSKEDSCSQGCGRPRSKGQRQEEWVSNILRSCFDFLSCLSKQKEDFQTSLLLSHNLLYC